jgi:hypothetical protein
MLPVLVAACTSSGAGPALSDAGDGGFSLSDAGDGGFCQQPLPGDAGLATAGEILMNVNPVPVALGGTFDDIPWAALCADAIPAANPAASPISRWTVPCDGLVGFCDTTGIDTPDECWYYDSATRRLVAIADIPGDCATSGGTYSCVCLYGQPGFRLPTDCSSGTFESVCLEDGGGGSASGSSSGGSGSNGSSSGGTLAVDSGLAAAADTGADTAPDAAADARAE